MNNLKNNVIFTVFIFLFATSITTAISFYLFGRENQKSDVIKIAVIDAEKLKNNARCFRAHEKIAKMLSEVIARMKISEDEIKSEYEALKDNEKLNDNQKRQQVSQIENKWTEISNKYNIEIQNIKNMDLKLSEYLENKLNNIVSRVSRVWKISVVLNKETKDSIIVFYNSKNIDITNLVVRELNKQIPIVNFKKVLND
ncbi:MAG: OmpH family outer membrane protein [Holosporales bacterium]|nr:OmpH family outer membrane protein [Holosporales bacterium]